MREMQLTSKQIKMLTQRHKVCCGQKECDRIKAILLRHKGWSLAKMAEALLIHEKFGVKYSVPGINKWLHQNRFSYKKPKVCPISLMRLNKLISLNITKL
jgi:transposase